MLSDIKKRIGNILSPFMKGKAETTMKEVSLWNGHDVCGDTLLHYAAKHNKIGLTQYLIESGSKVDDQNDCGQTPLILAVEKRHARIVEILLDAGADIDISDDANRTVLQLIIHYEETVRNGIARMILKKLKKDRCRDEEIGFRLLDAGWPIYCIIQLGNIQISRSILIHECSINFYFFHQYSLSAIVQSLTGTVEWLSKYVLTQENTCELLQNMSRRALDIFPIDELNKQVIYSVMRGIMHSWEEPECNLDSLSSIEKYLDYLDEMKDDMDRMMNGEWRYVIDRPASNIVLGLERQYVIAFAMHYVLNNDVELDVEVTASQNKYSQFPFKTHVLYKLTREQLDIIYKNILDSKYFIFGELLLAFLAFRQRSGKAIDKRTRITINSSIRLKNYFGFCQRLLTRVVYESVTLFQLLSDHKKQVTYLITNQEFLEAVTLFDERLKSESYYFHYLLEKRLQKAFFRDNRLCEYIVHLHYSRGEIPKMVLDFLSEEDAVALSKLRHILIPTSKSKLRQSTSNGSGIRSRLSSIIRHFNFGFGTEKIIMRCSCERKPRKLGKKSWAYN